MSADHDYGPTVQLFLAERDFAAFALPLCRTFDRALPEFFEAWPVRYPCSTRAPFSETAGSVSRLGSDHGVEIYTVSAWCQTFLQRPFPPEFGLEDWLSYPEQAFLTATAGAVFRDDVGELTRLRQSLEYFPTDVWLYKLAAQWGLIAEERAHVGRSGGVGDDIGSRVIAARMVENIMRLGMLIERRYAPYPKWFGSRFAELDCAASLSPILELILSADDWRDRERHLADACKLLAELQIQKKIPGATAPVPGSLHGRPLHFIDTLKIGEAIRNAITDAWLRQLPDFGAADQILKSNAILSVPNLAKASVEGVFATRLWWD